MQLGNWCNSSIGALGEIGATQFVIHLTAAAELVVPFQMRTVQQSQCTALHCCTAVGAIGAVGQLVQ